MTVSLAWAADNSLVKRGAIMPLSPLPLPQHCRVNLGPLSYGMVVITKRN
jgi:hypothetical protein